MTVVMYCIVLYCMLHRTYQYIGASQVAMDDGRSERMKIRHALRDVQSDPNPESPLQVLFVAMRIIIDRR